MTECEIKQVAKFIYKYPLISDEKVAKKFNIHELDAEEIRECSFPPIYFNN